MKNLTAASLGRAWALDQVANVTVAGRTEKKGRCRYTLGGTLHGKGKTIARPTRKRRLERKKKKAHKKSNKTARNLDRVTKQSAPPGKKGVGDKREHWKRRGTLAKKLSSETLIAIRRRTSLRGRLTDHQCGTERKEMVENGRPTREKKKNGIKAAELGWVAPQNGRQPATRKRRGERRGTRYQGRCGQRFSRKNFKLCRKPRVRGGGKTSGRPETG